MKLQLIAIAALGLGGTAVAQDLPQQMQQMQQMELPQQVQVPLDKAPALKDLTAARTGRAVGCIKHQVYNIQGLSRIATLFVLKTSSGDQRFNFEADAIRHLADGAPVPIATTGETNRWDRVLTTLERAAAADKPLLINYNLPGRDVYSINVQWEGNCAP